MARPLLHNLRSQVVDRDGIRREFLANARLLPKRKNGNALFHEILSFSHEDAGFLTAGGVEDLVRHYLEIRAPYALAYARAHFDTDHPHVHLLISANNLAARQRLRLSKAQFRRVQQDMERYQRERYPELQHSVAHFAGKPIEASRNTLRAGTQSSRCDPARRASRPFATWSSPSLRLPPPAATATAVFSTRGLRLYKRGRSIGIEDVGTGCRYRLKTLGLDTAFERARAQWLRMPPEITALPPLCPRASTTRSQPLMPPLPFCLFNLFPCLSPPPYILNLYSASRTGPFLLSRAAVTNAVARRLEAVRDRIRRGELDSFDAVRAAARAWSVNERVLIGISLDDQVRLLQRHAAEYDLVLAPCDIETLRQHVNGLAALVLGLLAEDKAIEALDVVLARITDLELDLSALTEKVEVDSVMGDTRRPQLPFARSASTKRAPGTSRNSET